MRSKLLRTLPVKYGRDFAAVMDGRTRLGRAVRDHFNALVQDLGGFDHLSHQQISLCRRATWLALVLENEEARIAEGGGIDIGGHTQLVGGLVSVYRLLGIKRVAREARLSDYLKRGEP